MSLTKIFILTGLFFIFSSFALGLAVLFGVIVPIEEQLTQLELSQTAINIAMVVIIVSYLILSVAITGIFYRRIVLKENRVKYAKYFIIVLLIIDAFAFYLLISTENSVVTDLQSIATEDQTQYAYGPYPSASKLQQLKDEGYTGVITLLSSTIPFESVLLEEEKQNGEKIGLPVYSYPMLPWVSGNESSIEGIKELLEKQKEGRFYIHCYLGKHRVDLVRQIVEAQYGVLENLRTFIYPANFERGDIFIYRDGQLLLGPYPTDTEWFNEILRGQAKKVISYLDPDIPEQAELIKQQELTCQDMDLECINIPIKKTDDGYSGIQDVIDAANASEVITFIHGSDQDEIMELLDGYFRTGVLADRKAAMPLGLSSGDIYEVNYNVYFGPQPIDIEFGRIYDAGVTEIKNIKDITDATRSPIIINHLLEYIAENPDVYYFYSSDPNTDLTQLGHTLNGRYYGIALEDFPDFISDVKRKYVRPRLIVGTKPDLKELEDMADQGMHTVIFIKGRDQQFDQSVFELENTVPQAGMEFKVVEYGNDHINQITEEVIKENNPVYVIIYPPSQYQLVEEIDAAKL
ncbi:hypothetical protein KKC88_03570 [Patescibacteria group bacterium]|nr:hypothetical protein [Patescibacteria group bacterium]MBU1673548.1 hypothetical protein [Patescibacteria group bacterium]MBU1963626.1 hypothetical protein [Patescibacteria group bacterium]